MKKNNSIPTHETMRCIDISPAPCCRQEILTDYSYGVEAHGYVAIMPQLGSIPHLMEFASQYRKLARA
jgi:hypothetical protein